jgi:glycosyltransferase involved in cell wall biosynthesis
MNQNPNQEEPLVSVVLNSFNAEKLIGEQIDSILRQTYKNLELIVCDDHSTDGTLEIVKEYVRKDARVRWVQNETNLGANDRHRGICLTFHRGFGLSKGEFIAISDADDFWLPNKIEMLTTYLLANPGVDLVFSNSEITSSDLSVKLGSLQEKQGNRRPSGLISIETLLERNLVAGHVTFFRRKIVPRILPFPEGWTFDSWVGLVCALNSPVGYIDECLVLYRQHGASLIGAEPRNLRYYVKRLNDPRFIIDYFNDKSGQLAAHRRLLAIGDISDISKNALAAKIANEEALLRVTGAAGIGQFGARLAGAAWTILRTSQKYHLKQWLFLAVSWRSIKSSGLQSKGMPR